MERPVSPAQLPDVRPATVHKRAEEESVLPIAGLAAINKPHKLSDDNGRVLNQEENKQTQQTQKSVVSAETSSIVGQTTVTKGLMLSGLNITKPITRAILGTLPTSQEMLNMLSQGKGVVNAEASKESLSTPFTDKMGRSFSGKENEVGRASQKKSERLANRPKSDLSMQEQATHLLMKKCGIIQPRKKVDEADHHRFKSQFVEPLMDNAVDGFCEAFGLNDLEGRPLNAMALEADE